MKRFIFLTFFFLGWAFYEMSGGSDFRPPEPPTAIAETEKATNPPLADADDFAPRPVIANLRPTKPRKQADSAQANALRAGLETAPAILAGPFSDTDAEPVKLATLATGDAAMGSAVAGEKKADIRQVIGTRVNMRQGPGTNYPVIARMNLGDAVEVLSDPGNGWLRLRDIRDRRMGWIAASLVGQKG